MRVFDVLKKDSSSKKIDLKYIKQFNRKHTTRYETLKFFTSSLFVISQGVKITFLFVDVVFNINLDYPKISTVYKFQQYSGIINKRCIFLT